MAYEIDFAESVEEHLHFLTPQNGRDSSMRSIGN